MNHRIKTKNIIIFVFHRPINSCTITWNEMHNGGGLKITKTAKRIISDIERRQEDKLRKDNAMKLQIKEQESLLAETMLKNKNILISNMWQFNDTKKRVTLHSCFSNI